MASTELRREQELLGPARAGDEAEFGRIVERHRAELHAHCYRMLGSIHDAEDALQETFLRAWRGLAEFGGRSSLRTWLYRIATNACLDAIARRPKRVLPVDHGPSAGFPLGDVGRPLVESVWIEPYPDESMEIADEHAGPEARYEQREAVELAFIAAVQHLPGTQRAVLILRDVLGYSARETAASLDTSVASVNSALQRARASVGERLPERNQQTTLRSLGDARVRQLVETYIDAWGSRDADAVAAVLAEDAVFSMPPWASWWHGRDTIARFTQEATCPEARQVPTRASGQAAVASYVLDADTGRFVAAAIDVLTFDGELIKEITAFVTPEIFPAFGLPSEITG